MARILRVMQEDGGYPRIGDTATCLGVRVPADISPDENGDVHSRSGGMSVAPSLETLPIHRIPRRLSDRVPGAAGNNGHRVWSMGQGNFEEGPVTPELRLLPDFVGATHGVVSPARTMALPRFRSALAATAPTWIIAE